MTLSRRTFTVAAAGVFAGAAWSEDKWPAKPITYIVPFPAGGTTDILARLIAQNLGPALNTAIVIENKGGAGGSVGSEVASAPRPPATRSSAARPARTPSTSASIRR